MSVNNIVTILDPAYCECHEIIMNPLKDDLVTLYSCILVNRSFCRVFIPILWRNPFKFVKNDDQLIKIFNTLIHCLHPSDKNNLVNKEFIQLEDLPTSQTYFKYHTLIKEFELNPLQRGIRLWVSDHLFQKLTRRSISRRVIKLNKYIGNLLFDKGNQYDSLNIYYNELLNGSKSLFDICKFENHEKSLVDVNKLSLGFFHGNTTELISPITENISKLQNKLSPNIQHLQISIKTFKEHSELSRNLIYFIGSQKKLKSLTTHIFWKEDEFVQPFLNSLQKQSSCLTFLKLQDSKIPNELLLSILKSLPNLITLYLDLAPSKHEGERLDHLHFNNLRHLHYNYEPSTVLVNNGWGGWGAWSNPSELLFRQILLTSKKLTSLKIECSFVKHFQIYPQSLTHLHLIVTPRNSMDNLINLLRNLRQLIYLKLDGNCTNRDHFLRYNYYLFKDFSLAIPNSLRIFENDLTITDGYLECLLNETHLNIQCIKLYHYLHYNNTSLRVFIDYAKRKKCFKELGISHDVVRGISKDCINEARNYFNIITYTNDEINNPFYDEPIKNSYWSKRANENTSLGTVPKNRPWRYTSH